MRRISIFGISVAILLTSFCWLWSQESMDRGQRYALLATKKTSTMQKELNVAAEEGFQVVMSAPTSGSEMVVLMERLATPEEPFQYRLLATTRTGTMDKELNEAGDLGFRLLPQTMIAKSQMLGGVEIVVLLEKAPDSSSVYQYKLLATSRTSTMEKEIGVAEEAGFVLVGICSRGEHVAIMEKELE